MAAWAFGSALVGPALGGGIAWAGPVDTANVPDAQRLARSATSAQPVTRADTERAAVGAGALAVRIETLTPAVPEAGDTLTVSGTIRNTTTAPVSSISAVLRVSPTPLPSRGEIPEVLSGAGQRVGLPIQGSAQEVAAELAPGASATFVMRAEVDDLGLASPGVYVTGVEALGSTGGGVTRQDIDRTFLPWWPPGTAAEPLLLTTLWPLSSAPVRDARGILLDESPAIEMSPAGRLATLLQAPAAHPEAVSLVIDPNTVAAAAQMADGYQVSSGDTVSDGTRSSEVAAWLSGVRGAVAAPAGDAVAMLNGYPDLVAASRGRVLASLLAQRELVDDLTEQALGSPLPSELAVLPGGVSDARTLGRLAAADVGTAVLSDRALPLTESNYFTPSGTVVVATERGPLRALVTDSGLVETLAMPMADSAEQTAVRQRLLAETLVTVLELPETQRLLVMAPDPGWSPPALAAQMVVDVIAGTPWLVPTSIGAALAREPSTLERTPAAYDEAAVAAELSSDQVRKVRRQVRDLGSYAKVLTDPAGLTPVTSTAPNRGMSAWYRSDADLGRQLVDTVSDQVAAAIESVRVVSSGSVTVSGASGTVPITVENLGEQSVTVGLELTSSPPQLFEADPVPPFVIEPGRRISVEVVAQVAAAGPIPVTIQLTTADGQDFGSPGTVTVQSSAYANAARILVRVALAALALAVVVHGIRRARRMRRARRTDRPAATPDRTPDQTHAEVPGA